MTARRVFDLGDQGAEFFCPGCGAGYVADSTVCTDCGLELVPRSMVKAIRDAITQDEVGQLVEKRVGPNPSPVVKWHPGKIALLWGIQFTLLLALAPWYYREPERYILWLFLSIPAIVLTWTWLGYQKRQ